MLPEWHGIARPGEADAPLGSRVWSRVASPDFREVPAKILRYFLNFHSYARMIPEFLPQCRSHRQQEILGA